MDPVKTKRRPLVMGLMVIFAIAATVGIMYAAIEDFDLLGQPGLLYYDGDEWTETDHLPHDPLRIAVDLNLYLTREAEDGLTAFYATLPRWTMVHAEQGDTPRTLMSRYDADRVKNLDEDNWDDPLNHRDRLWLEGTIHFTRDDFGTASDRVGERFVTLPGAEVAAITDDHVIYYDGLVWRALPDETGPEWHAIAAHAVEEWVFVWIADDAGNLRRYVVAGQETSVETYRLQDFDLPASDDVQLAALDTDTLIILAGGQVVANQSGQSVPLRAPDGLVLQKIVGVTEGWVWFQADATLVGLEVTDTVWVTATAGELGLAADTVFLRIDAAPTGQGSYVRWLATSDGVLRNTVNAPQLPGTWHMIYQPERQPIDVAAVPGTDTAWLALDDGVAPIYGESVWLFILSSALVLGYGVLVVALLVGDRFRQPVKQPSVPGADEDDEPDVGLLMALIKLSPVLVIGLIGFGLLLVLGEEALPTLEEAVNWMDGTVEDTGAPRVVKEVIKDVVFTLLFLGMMVPLALVALALFPQLRKRVTWSEIAIGAAVILFGSLLETIMTTASEEGVAWYCIGALAALMLILLVIAAVLMFFTGETNSLTGKVRHGLYDEAIEASQRGVDRMPKAAHTQWVYGTTLMNAGRFDEAEEVLKEAVALAQKQAVVGKIVLFSATENLGTVYLMQGRYQEAADTLEAAVQEKKTAWAQMRLAEVLLFQGREPDEALQRLERAAKMHKRGEFQLPAEIEANRAWALALLGRRQEAEAAIEKAFTLLKRRYDSALAGLHWRAGQVYQALNQRDQARQHFQQALDVDPVGFYAAHVRRDMVD